MKKKILRSAIYIFLVTSILFLTSCMQPSPLTGTWADNKGNQLTLFADYKYAAKIKKSSGDIRSYSGNYNVLLNAISFTADNGYQVVSEWDIRVNKLYLNWPDENNKDLELTLFKIKN